MKKDLIKMVTTMIDYYKFVLANASTSPVPISPDDFNTRIAYVEKLHLYITNNYYKVENAARGIKSQPKRIDSRKNNKKKSPQRKQVTPVKTVVASSTSPIGGSMTTTSFAITSSTSSSSSSSMETKTAKQESRITSGLEKIRAQQRMILDICLIFRNPYMTHVLLSSIQKRLYAHTVSPDAYPSSSSSHSSDATLQDYYGLPIERLEDDERLVDLCSLYLLGQQATRICSMTDPAIFWPYSSLYHNEASISRSLPIVLISKFGK
jgi:hypothetical protein